VKKTKDCAVAIVIADEQEISPESVAEARRSEVAIGLAASER
jgi:hypothetical protein